jgi:hypothetical protein
VHPFFFLFFFLGRGIKELVKLAETDNMDQLMRDDINQQRQQGQLLFSRVLRIL